MRMYLLRVSLPLLLSGTSLALPLDQSLGQDLSDRDLTNTDTGKVQAVIGPIETKELLKTRKSRRINIDYYNGLNLDKELTQSPISKAEHDGFVSAPSGWITPRGAPHVKDLAVESRLSQVEIRPSKVPQDNSEAVHKAHLRLDKRRAKKARLEPRQPSIGDSQRAVLKGYLRGQNEIYEKEYLGEENKVKKDRLERGLGSPEELRRYHGLRDLSLRYYELILDVKYPATENSPTAQENPTTGENPAGRGNPRNGENPTAHGNSKTWQRPTRNPATEKPIIRKPSTAQQNPSTGDSPGHIENPTARENPTAQQNPSTGESPGHRENPPARENPSIGQKASIPQNRVVATRRVLLRKKFAPKSLQHIEGIDDIYREAQLFENKYLGPLKESERLRLERGDGTPQEIERFNNLKRSYERYGELYRTSRRPLESTGAKTPLDLKRYSIGGEYRELESLRRVRNDFANEFFGNPEQKLRFERLKNSIGKTPEQLRELGTTVEELEAFEPRYNSWRRFEQLYQKIWTRANRAKGPKTKEQQQLNEQATVKKVVETNRGPNSRSSQTTPQHENPGVSDGVGEEPKAGASEPTSETPKKQASERAKSSKWGTQQEADELAIMCIEGERSQAEWYVAHYGLSRMALKECLKAVTRKTGYIPNILPEHEHDVQLVIDEIYRNCIDQGKSHDECMRESSRESANIKHRPKPGFFPMITEGASKMWNSFKDKVGPVVDKVEKIGNNHGRPSGPAGGGRLPLPGRIPGPFKFAP